MNQIENRMIQRNLSIHVWLCLKKTKISQSHIFFMLDSCALCWLAEAAQSMQICSLVLALVPPAAGIHRDLFHPSIINLPIESLESSRPDDCSEDSERQKKREKKKVQCCYISRTPPIRKKCLDEFWFVPCWAKSVPCKRNFVKVLSWKRSGLDKHMLLANKHRQDLRRTTYAAIYCNVCY